MRMRRKFEILNVRMRRSYCACAEVQTCAEASAHAQIQIQIQFEFEFAPAQKRARIFDFLNWFWIQIQYSADSRIIFCFEGSHMSDDARRLENIQYIRLNEIEIRVESKSELLSEFNVEYSWIWICINFYCRI